EYICRFKGTLTDKIDIVVEVEVPIHTLCPCSKEISAKSAHNQRGIAKVAYRASDFVWIEDIIRLIEGSSSSEVYALLKREDEKFVTEYAYDNPRFVEDVVREIADKLLKRSDITWFSIEVENFESIHKHNAYAYMEHDRRSRRS
ncbi:MAG TPA: GTP cyclohydrolase I FolE2, partial [Proteobacteria bacterium]|nr:GTP cyclohydrolase I FolE2 [Pseudomonadota bacterium]